MKEERDLDKEKKLFPVFYNDKYWSKFECGSVFKALYHNRIMLRNDGAVYVGDGSWVFPDDTFEHDENR
jgi:hypothetical protein